jgi:hypothetical protein
MKNRLLVTLTILFVLGLFLTTGLNAQAGQGRGRLNGTVLDPTGKPIANATITLEFENAGKKFEATCNQKGEWALIGLGTGRCNIIVVADGFLPVTQQVPCYCKGDFCLRRD